VQPTDEQRPAVESAERSILVRARPGRGKTAVALMFAREVIRTGKVQSHRQVLFLTFSRNAVYQIDQSIRSGRILDYATRRQVRVATYHSFMWWLIQAFGRYNGLPPNLDWMGETRARLCRERTARLRGAGCSCDQLAKDYGAASYDMFAPLALDLLHRSSTLRELLWRRYPVVVVDEFQDTGDEHWELVKLLSEPGRLMCLADPDQMIFRRSGASDERLQQLLHERKTQEYTFSKCLRTDDHVLLDFAEAILDGIQPDAALCRLYRRRFLSAYPYAKTMGPWLKGIMARFNADFGKRGPRGVHPSIAVAAYSNAWAAKLRRMLMKPTPQGPKVYGCALLEPDRDDALEVLVLALSDWILTGGTASLWDAMQLTVALLPDRAVRRNASLVDLLHSTPSTAEQGTSRQGLAAEIVKLYTNAHEPACSTAGEAVQRALHAVSALREKSAAVQDCIPDEDMTSCKTAIDALLLDAKYVAGQAVLTHLRRRLSDSRVHECIVQRAQPMRGRVSSTLHKLKGKEFDYVCVVTLRAYP
jgi:DNA helicase-2/ATP-dependent DNA helicase PcrA